MPSPLPDVCISKAHMTWPAMMNGRNADAVPELMTFPQLLNEAELREHLQDRGHPPVPSLANRPSCTLNLPRPGDRRRRSHHHCRRGGGKTTPFVRATIPAAALLWEGLAVMAKRQEGRRTCKGRTCLRQLSQSPAQGRVCSGLQEPQSSTAGPSIASQPL